MPILPLLLLVACAPKGGLLPSQDTADTGAPPACTCWIDGDGDGHGDPDRVQTTCDPAADCVSEGDDCDDGDPAIHPGAQETCDGLDNDCDPATQEVVPSWAADTDGDGYGDPTTAVESCEAVEGLVEDATDCDDTDAAIHPGALEVCDGVDNDCDAATADVPTWYRDADGDGWGDGADTRESCDAPRGFVAEGTDCDDRQAAVHPGAPEVCDGLDNDCDPATVEDTLLLYEDGDRDGYGDPSSSSEQCEVSRGWVDDSTDCDDSQAAVNPGAREVCDGLDNDCDAATPDGTVTLYQDADLDGYGNEATASEVCPDTEGWTADGTDCDDARASVYPGATERCDSLDNDCDGTVDDTPTECFLTLLWSDDFEDGDWSDWTVEDLGGSGETWALSTTVAPTTVIWEASNSGNSVAVGPDQGAEDAWLAQGDVDVLTADLCNSAGLVVGFQSTRDYLLVRMQDPTGYYGTYPRGGNLDLYQCAGGRCASLGAASGSVEVVAGTPTTFSIQVEAGLATVSVGGAEVLSASVTATGPFQVGGWSEDCDNGVAFDNFMVWSL